jgi:hypothetical protein
MVEYNPIIGCVIEVGHNGSKMLGDEYVSYSDVRVEAIGIDWVVVRTEHGKSLSATFADAMTYNEIEKELMS